MKSFSDMQCLSQVDACKPVLWSAWIIALHTYTTLGNATTCHALKQQALDFNKCHVDSWFIRPKIVWVLIKRQGHIVHVDAHIWVIPCHSPVALDAQHGLLLESLSALQVEALDFFVQTRVRFTAEHHFIVMRNFRNLKSTQRKTTEMPWQQIENPWAD